MKGRTVQLYSGGLDSYIISKLINPDVKLYFDYGTEQNRLEMSVLPDDVIVKPLPIGEYTQNDGLSTIPLRNLLFAAIAVNYGETIIIGGLKSDLHYDKKPEFTSKTTELFNSVLEKERQPKTVEVIVPFSNMTKTDLIVEYLLKGFKLEDLDRYSWSCHTPDNGKPCGHCQACNARRHAIEEALKVIEGINEYEE